MAKVITDASIRGAIRDVTKGLKGSITLSDPSPRGAGNLIIIVKPGRAEWYARRFVDGKPLKAKLGAYPAMSLADARDAFAGAKASPAERAAEKAKQAAGAATLGALFDGYIESRRAADKPSVIQIERILSDAGEKIGRDRLAKDITPADIVAVIRPIYERDARVQADKYRMYIGAAFTWAMKATHDYRMKACRDWGITSNPVAAVPRDTEAEGVGNRWLSLDEYRDLLTRMAAPQRARSRVHLAVQLIMLTGQRTREITSLRADQWNSKERLLSWEKTKNGLPHVLPVCDRAAAILDALKPSAAGWLFPNEGSDAKPMPDGTVLVSLKRYCARHGVPAFNGRDLRRTWKTLAGTAGLSKVERDLLQNHTEGDVSSKHYDRYDNLREKRAAVVKWQEWLEAEMKKARD